MLQLLTRSADNAFETVFEPPTTPWAAWMGWKPIDDDWEIPLADWPKKLPLAYSSYICSEDNYNAFQTFMRACPVEVSRHYSYFVQVFYHQISVPAPDGLTDRVLPNLEECRNVHGFVDCTGYIYNVPRAQCPIGYSHCYGCRHGLGGMSFYILGPWTCVKVYNAIVHNKQWEKQVYSGVWKSCKESWYPCFSCRYVNVADNPAYADRYARRGPLVRPDQRWRYGGQHLGSVEQQSASPLDAVNRPLWSQSRQYTDPTW
jgi:hypothetical protein